MRVLTVDLTRMYACVDWILIFEAGEGFPPQGFFLFGVIFFLQFLEFFLRPSWCFPAPDVIAKTLHNNGLISVCYLNDVTAFSQVITYELSLS